MKRCSIMALAVLISILGFHSKAFALGLGLYLQGGGGSTEWETNFEDDPFDETFKWEKDRKEAVIGFVLDSTVAKDKLFNYRLSIGYANITYEKGDNNSDWLFSKSDKDLMEYDLDGIVFDQDFGFGIVRTEHFRLWVGPEVRIGFYTGELEIPYYPATIDLNMFELGLGPVVGANFSLGPVATIALKGGFIGTWAHCEMDDPFYGFLDGDSDVTGGEAFVNAGIIFRINDNFLP